MSEKKTQPENGALQVWWIPQIPGKPFYVDVATPEEAQKIMSVLAKYDIFQYENKIKPDYCNAGGLRCFNQEGVGTAYEQEWAEWYDEETGDDIDQWRPESETAS
jgi:hypothetical protein